MARNEWKMTYQWWIFHIGRCHKTTCKHVGTEVGNKCDFVFILGLNMFSLIRNETWFTLKNCSHQTSRCIVGITSFDHASDHEFWSKSNEPIKWKMVAKSQAERRQIERYYPGITMKHMWADEEAQRQLPTMGRKQNLCPESKTKRPRHETCLRRTCTSQRWTMKFQTYLGKRCFLKTCSHMFTLNMFRYRHERSIRIQSTKVRGNQCNSVEPGQSYNAFYANSL